MISAAVMSWAIESHKAGCVHFLYNSFHAYKRVQLAPICPETGSFLH
jgi:hypothetical protein